MTDLPDAVVELTDPPDAVVNAAVEAFARKRNPKHNTLDHSETLAIRAALAAASGPWAEQLNAAKAERDRAQKLLLTTQRGIASDTEVMDLRADLDAALARNAELERDRDWWKQTCEYWHEQTTDRDHRIRLYNLSLEQAEARESALRAELDNLRDRLNALAASYDDIPAAEVFMPSEVRQLVQELRAMVRGSDDE